MIDYYSKRAGEYEAIYHKPERQVDLQRLRSHLQKSFVDKTVLELACGTGYWTSVIAPSAKSIVAVDASAAVLEIARNKDYQGTPVQFIWENVYALQQVMGSFDAGLAAFWWSHIPKDKQPTFLDHFHGQLESGASVCFIDNQYVDGSSTPISRTDDAGNTYQLRRLSDGTEYEVMKNFPSEEELKQVLLGKAENTVFQDFTYYWCLQYTVQ